MKKIKKGSFVLSLLIITLFILKQIIPILKLDGYSGLILSMQLQEDTIFSHKYTHEKFEQIKIGMTQEDVGKILGEPIVQWTPKQGINALQYSTSLTDTHYRLRQIYLKDNKVIDRISYFYID